MADSSYRGNLEIYDRTNLNAARPISVLTTSDAKFVICEFTVAKGYLNKSTFSLTRIFLNRDGQESTTGIVYWFYLHDFVDAIKPSKP